MTVSYGRSSGIGGRCSGSKNDLYGSCWRIGDITCVGGEVERARKENGLCGGENLLSRATITDTSCNQAGKLKPSLLISGRARQDFCSRSRWKYCFVESLKFAESWKI